ncbi:high-affinity choline transporter BetT [Auritidibacter sp. NML120779]|uniref:choline BCCT transporter BetT n=1 Tax=Auritidibacter ignavus TaxID=678932 RepID=UPI000D72824E|nr:choline BCCT transporter BetT [Auritidibacter ignavus]PXA76610.1 high-affinity choline transporter BetT [Auritidibacter sp. NML120779]
MSAATSVTEAQQSPEDDLSDSSAPSKVNWPVFWGALIILVAFVLFASIWPSTAENAIFGAMGWVSENFGWYYVLTAAIVVVFVLIVALTRSGRTRLGPDHARPKYNMFTWAAMLFAAGIGVDLMFFGISGPATNYLTPPDVAPESEEAARMAPIWTIFHYGIPGWAMYALLGMAFGLFAYRYHLPLSIRSALAPIFGKRIHGPVGHTVEIAATIGTISGIAVSLGIGVVFLNYGLSAMFDIPQSMTVQIALMAISVLIAIVSTVSGVDKGIRLLSELNIYLAIALLAWILIADNTTQLLNALVQNIGDFFSSMPSMLMNTFAYTDGQAPELPADQWMADWTLFFWAWWIAWAPFVALFLARISRGRTLREFVVGVLLIPFAFILLWVSILGNAALGFFQSDPTFLEETYNTPESGFFTLLEQYPGSLFTIGLAVLTGLFFYVTSADSGSLVMANMTSKATMADSDGPSWLRIVWAVVTGALTLSMLFIDGVYTLQAFTVIVGLPLSIMLYLVMYSLWKMLRHERLVALSQARALPTALSSRTNQSGERIKWQQRLRHRMSFASHKQLTEYVNTVAAPAIEEVAAEIEALGGDVQCHRGQHPEHGLPYVDLVVHFTDQEDFKYQAYPVAYPVPSFATNIRTVQEVFFKLEVFSNTGSRGRDIYGLSKDQVISDVLDSYDTHMAYMSMAGEDGAPVPADETFTPETWNDTDQADTSSIDQVPVPEPTSAQDTDSKNS